MQERCVRCHKLVEILGPKNGRTCVAISNEPAAGVVKAIGWEGLPEVCKEHATTCLAYQKLNGALED